MKECETCENKSPEEEKKVYKTKFCLNIYKILYYNPIFNIRCPKFLITNFKKIDELINTEKSFFETFLENNSEYKSIHKYMSDIYNFCKEYENINKVNLNENIDLDDYNKFLDEYVKFLNIMYESNIYKNINNYEKPETDIDIDINNLSDCCFVLNL